MLNKDETSNWQTTKDPQGRRILDPEQNKENIARYYEDLYSHKSGPYHPYHDTLKETIDQLSKRPDEVDSHNELEKLPTSKEVEEVIQKKKNKKATTDWNNVIRKRGGVAMV